MILKFILLAFSMFSIAFVLHLFFDCFSEKLYTFDDNLDTPLFEQMDIARKRLSPKDYFLIIFPIFLIVLGEFSFLLLGNYCLLKLMGF